MKQLLLFLACIPFAGRVAAQTGASFGEGIHYTAADTSFDLKFAFRIQPLLVYRFPVMSSPADPDPDQLQMTIRRARLKFDGFAFSPKVKYKLELALGNRNLGGTSSHTRMGARLILDAVIKWEFLPDVELWAGQTKLPGNRERVVSSQDLQFVDRSIVNGAFNVDRDIGVQLHGTHSLGSTPFKWALAFSKGEGRNITDYNRGGLEYTARLEWHPLGAFIGKSDYSQSDLKRHPTPRLAIGITYDNNQNAVREEGNQGSYLADTNGTLFHRSLQTWLVDLCFRYQGWSLESEFAHKSTDNPVISENVMTPVAYYTGTGFTSQLAYLFKCNWEIGARYSIVEPDEMVDPKYGRQMQYTLGLSKYVVGHNLKIQSDLSRTIYEFADPFWQFRLQAELGI